MAPQPNTPELLAAMQPAHLRLEFTNTSATSSCLLSLVSLFSSSALAVSAIDAGGRRHTDLDFPECARLLRTGKAQRVELTLTLPATSARIALDAEPDGLALTVQLPLDAQGPAAGLLWLQADPDWLGAAPLLALPLKGSGFAPAAFHALVGVAARTGDLRQASAPGQGDGATICQWVPDQQPANGRPLVGYEGDAFWQPSPPGLSTGTAAAWFVGEEPQPAPSLLPPDWLAGLQVLARAPFDAAALTAHLQALTPGSPPWRVMDVAQARTGDYASPPEAGALLRLIPTAEEVIVAVDTATTPELLEAALLHAAGHIALGHVRPGDTWGHWDTHASISANPSFRRWDRDVRAWLQETVPQPATRQVGSLAECNAQEKAWLVLLDHIGRMVGEARTLHPAAERYQSAAYQRQAAQRLVSQLEEYSGAMLCDGVGLGKTYVATTVLVHYANAWRDQLANAARSAAEDPFRITVLAPNSVVSTWRREAIPALGAHGVPVAGIRVISHSKLSRILPTSEILQQNGSSLSDMEHLLLSDLVIVDEAHNFRSVGARRTTVLRDLLRLQPRRDLRRKVLLLTATPVNNSLEDLRQQAALLFSKPLWFNDNLTTDGYRTKVFKDIQERIRKATRSGSGDVAATLIHGSGESRFSYAPEFRDDLQFGVQIPRIGDYLKEQEKLLTTQQAAVRAAMQDQDAPPAATVRVAGELLDRIVVQRSRALCKQIEREQGTNVKLLFRPDAPDPEKLVYEDVYDDTRDVLARFLPLFETAEDADLGPVSSLSLKVYMWADVRDGIRSADEISSVVGLQRVLVLKRLESSPVAFLITLLRLLALHAHRLMQLSNLCHDLADRERATGLDEAITALVERLPPVERDRIDLLLTGAVSSLQGRDLLKRWSQAHVSAKAAADADDPVPPQLSLLEPEGPAAEDRREQLNRLWGLQEDLTRDLGTLLATAPGLADIVFGRFAETDWPRAFINGGQNVDWPDSAGWAMRIVKDGKVRRLVARLLKARAQGQKVIVFSQFTDTLAYVESVLKATPALDRHDWTVVTALLSADAGLTVTQQDVQALVARSAVVSGDTEDRDQIIHAFAPFYRLGPWRPVPTGVSPDMQLLLEQQWRHGWTLALQHPIEVLFATDVLAEGVNLQDVALLVNFDVHWNPVRMIQRAGRIDRRLNPAIEEASAFPDLDALAAELNVASPRYWWHAHPGAAPATVNLLLPDDLEAELQLRERIANKTLAIDFTLGLEQGTGAEADWMASYRYQGISALNAWQGDRAIEQIAGYQQRLRRLMRERNIEPAWVEQWNGWLRETGADDEGQILAWANLARKGGNATAYTRQLQPRIVDGIPHWLWTTAKPEHSLLNFWLALDGKTFPATIRKDIAFHDNASRPVSADDLLQASRRLIDRDANLQELGRDVGRPFQQGASAISAGFFCDEVDRRGIQIKGFRLLQLRQIDVAIEPTTRSEEKC